MICAPLPSKLERQSALIPVHAVTLLSMVMEAAHPDTMCLTHYTLTQSLGMRRLQTLRPPLFSGKSACEGSLLTLDICIFLMLVSSDS